MNYRDFEDVAVLFFDSDGDGDQDLYVGAGGNNMEKGGRESQHRLYKNDGQGNFVLNKTSFPNNEMNISVAVNYDYDGDGDEDLYVGSRSVPYGYGISPRSYVYENDGKGKFREVTEELNAGLSTRGMITGAEWVNVTGDPGAELVLCGEWMSPVIYSYDRKSRKLVEVKQTGLEELHGLWQSLGAGDLNGDGKMDLVLGNIGENFYLRPSKENPVKLWLNDFDKSGTVDQFLTRTVEGRDMPVFLKREITDQFPALKKQNLRHSEYARRSIGELFGEDLMKSSQQKKFEYCQSVVAMNEGNGKFRIEVLPQRVQLSSVNAIMVSDINDDGRVDIMMGGNMFVFPPQFGRLDASYGHMLLNEGQGRLKYIENHESGMHIRGAIKDIEMIGTGQNKYIVVAVNNEKTLVYNLSLGK